MHLCYTLFQLTTLTIYLMEKSPFIGYIYTFHTAGFIAAKTGAEVAGAKM